MEVFSEILAIIQAIIAILAGLTVFLLDYMYWKTIVDPWRWIKLAYASMGFYWAGLYVYVTLAAFNIIPTIEPVFFGRTFVRTPIIIFLGIVAAGAIIRWQSQTGHSGIKSLIKDIAEFYFGGK